jgi:hypothetical protein
VVKPVLEIAPEAHFNLACAILVDDLWRWGCRPSRRDEFFHRI